jgi:hypothetical protein
VNRYQRRSQPVQSVFVELRFYCLVIGPVNFLFAKRLGGDIQITVTRHDVTVTHCQEYSRIVQRAIAIDYQTRKARKHSGRIETVREAASEIAGSKVTGYMPIECGFGQTEVSEGGRDRAAGMIAHQQNPGGATRIDCFIRRRVARHKQRRPGSQSDRVAVNVRLRFRILVLQDATSGKHETRQSLICTTGRCKHERTRLPQRIRDACDAASPAGRSGKSQ